MLLGVNAYSRLIPARGNLIRQRVSGSVTLLRNRTGTEPLRINNELGLPDFGAGNIMANSRGSLWSETMFFLNKKLFGIRFAPFAFGGYTLVSTEKQLWHHPSGYSAIGAGVRMRNENLIFGTVEVRGVYFPRLVPDVTPFNLTVTTNLRYRYNDTYVRPPDILNYNDNN